MLRRLGGGGLSPPTQPQTPLMEEGLVLRGKPAAPLPQVGGGQRSLILGVPSFFIYEYTLCRRTTKLDEVTDRCRLRLWVSPVTECPWVSHAYTILRGRIEFQGCPILGLGLSRIYTYTL